MEVQKFLGFGGREGGGNLDTVQPIDRHIHA